ncbi:TPA_asm: protein 4 [Ranunculus virus 1]|uniref:Protein 4 n=1 Tax=Ranunculus virus 1 TaxID=2977983 RepID=A0A9N7AB55_9RHAB|nr:TPA_asm: protein 4 [Ranunculus virus 1]
MTTIISYHLKDFHIPENIDLSDLSFQKQYKEKQRILKKIYMELSKDCVQGECIFHKQFNNPETIFVTEMQNILNPICDVAFLSSRNKNNFSSCLQNDLKLFQRKMKKKIKTDCHFHLTDLESHMICWECTQLLVQNDSPINQIIHLYQTRVLNRPLPSSNFDPELTFSRFNLKHQTNEKEYLGDDHESSSASSGYTNYSY